MAPATTIPATTAMTRFTHSPLPARLTSFALPARFADPGPGAAAPAGLRPVAGERQQVRSAVAREEADKGPVIKAVLAALDGGTSANWVPAPGTPPSPG